MADNRRDFIDAAFDRRPLFADTMVVVQPRLKDSGIGRLNGSPDMLMVTDRRITQSVEPKARIGAITRERQAPPMNAYDPRVMYQTTQVGLISRENMDVANTREMRREGTKLGLLVPNPELHRRMHRGVSGLGTILEAFASYTSGDELNHLNAAISKLNDGLISAYNTLDKLEKQRKEAEQSGEAGANLAVQRGYEAIVAYHFMTRKTALVFESVKGSIGDVYIGIDNYLNSYRAWNDTMARRVWPLGYTGVLYTRLESEHQLIAGALTYADPNAEAFLPTAGQAVQKLTGINTDDRTGSGLGELTILAFVAILIISLAAIIVATQITAFAAERNVGVRAAAASRDKFEDRVAAEKNAFIQAEIARGTDQASAYRKWEPIEAKMRAEQANVEADLRKNPPGEGGWILPAIGGFLLLIGGIAAINAVNQ